MVLPQTILCWRCNKSFVVGVEHICEDIKREIVEAKALLSSHVQPEAAKNTIEAVECMVCGRLHKASSQHFLSFHGNVCIGLNGGIIGNNLDEDGKVIRVQFICHNRECLDKMLLDCLDGVS